MTIGTHTATHPDMGRLSESAQRKEIMRGVRAITSRGGPYPHLFRPPYDSYNATTLFVLRNLRMRLVLQTVDTQNWLPTATRKTIARRAIAGARPGGIILMHDGGGNRSATVQALPWIVRALHNRGYRLVNVPTLLRENPPPLNRPVPFSACARQAPGAAPTEQTAEKDALGSPWTWRAMLRVR
jgi:peptidoglycan/xylan/chitin deacetylase (PgdA/CDA1 family)